MPMRRGRSHHRRKIPKAGVGATRKASAARPVRKLLAEMDAQTQHLLSLMEVAKKRLDAETIGHLVSSIHSTPSDVTRDLLFTAAFALNCSTQDAEALARRWKELEAMRIGRNRKK